jgi:hypothetical protein
MDVTQIAKQMIDFQKTVIDNSFNALTVVQDQTESMINSYLGQLPKITEEGKNQMNETIAYTKKARDDFKKAMDKGYEQFEKILNQK